MSGRQRQESTLDERGDERHPSFAILSAARVSSMPGATLFDSEVKHGHYVVVRVETATRHRDLNRDWIHGRKTVLEVAVSEAQFGKFVSSLNSGGTPATLTYSNLNAVECGPGLVPELPFAPRMEKQHHETVDAANRAFERIRKAYVEFVDKPTAANKRSLGSAIEGTRSNLDFAAESLTDFAETVVAKAKADIEAMMESKVRSLGLQAAVEQGVIELPNPAEATS